MKSVFLLFCLLCSLPSTLPAAQRDAAHYRLKGGQNGAIRELDFMRCPWREALPLFEGHLHASIRLDTRVQEEVSRKPISFHFETITWENALKVLAVTNDYRLVAESPRRFRISAR